MKFLYATILFLLLVPDLQAQVSFSKVPKDYQLYPRNSQSLGTVAVAGTVTDSRVTRISVQVFRGTTLYRTVAQPLSFQNNRATFALNPTIKAEPMEYQIRIYAVRGSDSTLVAERKNIVAGDVFMIDGQSNAVAGPGDGQYQMENTQLNEFCRSYTTEGDKWVLANAAYANVGVWGTELQRLIRQNDQIPTCILNNGEGGMPIVYFNDRNAASPTDVKTKYGRSLTRAIQAGVKENIKAIFWRQGEFEVGGNSSSITSYPAQFDKLYKSWQTDFPALEKVYVTQTGIQPIAESPLAPTVRDFQRRTAQLYPNVRTIATMGLTITDGIHYGSVSHVDFAQKLYAMVARDLYGPKKDTLQINCPDPRKIFYSKSDQTQITIEFDLDQQMIFQNEFNTISYQTKAPYTFPMRDYLYFDGANNTLDSGWAEGNRVHLRLKNPSTAKKLTYLPPYFSSPHYYAYQGPYMLNKRGRYAFSFYEVPIDSYQPIQSFVGSNEELRMIHLKWNKLENTRAINLERSENGKDFKLLGNLGNEVTKFTDSTVAAGTMYVYRLTTTLASGQRIATQVMVVAQVITAVESSSGREPLVVQLYPNPAQQEVMIALENPERARIEIIDLTGMIRQQQETTDARTRINVQHLPNGLYLVRVQTASGTHTQRLLIRR